MPSLSKAKIAQTLVEVRAALVHAFAVRPSQPDLTAEDLALLERVAATIDKRGMAAPATVFLESMGPMSFLGSQALHFLAPILEFAFNAKEVEQVARLLERRDTVSRLIELLEARSSKTGAPPP